MSHTFWKLVNVIMASSLTGSPDLFPSSRNQSFCSSSLSTSSRDFRWRKTARASSRSLSFFDFTMSHRIIWAILYGSYTMVFYDILYHMLHIIYTGIIRNVTSGIIIQPIVSFLEHIALAKSFSKREPQERILDSGQRNSRIFFMIWAGRKVRWSSESIKLIQLKN